MSDKRVFDGEFELAVVEQDESSITFEWPAGDDVPDRVQRFDAHEFPKQLCATRQEPLAKAQEPEWNSEPTQIIHLRDIGMSPNYTSHGEPELTNGIKPAFRAEAITIALMQAMGISEVRFARQHLVDASACQLAMIQDGDDFYFEIVQPSGEPNG